MLLFVVLPTFSAGFLVEERMCVAQVRDIANLVGRGDRYLGCLYEMLAAHLRSKKGRTC